MAASRVPVQAPWAGPQLQPVLKHATRVSQRGQAVTAVQPTACFSASTAVASQGLPGIQATTLSTDSAAAAAAAAKQPLDAQHKSANASRQSARVTKSQKAATAKQQQQQAEGPVANVQFDCQQLKLLPGDLPLHSECWSGCGAAQQSLVNQVRYMQRAALADNSIHAIKEDIAQEAIYLVLQKMGRHNCCSRLGRRTPWIS
ncbi:hypothetical protein ABBQ38_001202 [Trebouxia sp. C0009 RCD-2024]